MKYRKLMGAVICILLLAGCGKSVQPETEAKTVSETESETQTKAETESETQTKAETESETQMQTESEKGPLIVVDAGHQGPGQDMSGTEPNGPGSSEMKAKLATGTSGTTTGLPEYELNLDVALALEEELLNRGYQVMMTRTTHDTSIGNIERADIANNAGADALVRIHANGSEDSSVAGALTMTPSPSNLYTGDIYEECLRLSEDIINQYCESTGLENRGVLAMDDMTGINWSKVPVTIVEMGFMTNPGDDTYMAQPENLPAIVQGIANGMDVYFGR